MHPQYKAIAAKRQPEPAPLPPLERTSWTFFNAAAETLEGANPEPQTDDAPRSGRSEGGLMHPWRRPLALSVTGLLLLLGIELSSSAPRPPWSGRPLTTPTTTERVEQVSAPRDEPTGQMVSLASSSAKYESYAQMEDSDPEQVPAIETARAPVSAAPTPLKAPFALPVAPAIRPKQLRDALPAQPAPRPAAQPAAQPAAREHGSAVSIDTFIRQWRAAHDSAQARLEGGMRVSRLSDLFGASRLSPSGGVTETRMGLAGASNFIRVYRQQRAVIERQYQDSFTVVSKRLGWSPTAIRRWYGRLTPKESPAAVELTTSLISGVDSLLGVLDAQAGAYTITPRTIQFDDPAAKESYSAVRQRIAATVDSASLLVGPDTSTPIGYLLQAIGTTRPPLEI